MPPPPPQQPSPQRPQRLQWLHRRILPAAQQRTLGELTAELDHRAGDRSGKLSAFWTMMALSAVIATAGVTNDSTATVIGAMIIAPLSRPIMGTALAVVKRERTGAGLLALGGAGLVILVGLVMALFLPEGYDLLDNTQVADRTSPGALDLVAALATGLAGAVALARKDVGAVLPGVAIAISLVPPLAVVGVCLGQGDARLAGGALLLFASNVLALVLAGMFVFAALGYATVADREHRGTTRRARVTLAVVFVVVATPLVAHSVLTYTVTVWTGRAEAAAERWLADDAAEVTDVQLNATTFQISVRTPGELPPFEALREEMAKDLPDTFGVVVVTTRGRSYEAGVIQP